ncbi:hypothetical protein JHK85_043842 [Glycine max]|nr:hypothetical protein JHK85_043842 [Glycine max]
MSGVLAMLALQCSLERASAQPASVGAVAVEHCGISGSYLQNSLVWPEFLFRKQADTLMLRLAACLFLIDALSKSSFEKYSSKARESLASWAPDCIGFNLIEAVLCHICRKERPGAVLLAGTAKSRFSAKDYSDHMALV